MNAQAFLKLTRGEFVRNRESFFIVDTVNLYFIALRDVYADWCLTVYRDDVRNGRVAVLNFVESLEANHYSPLVKNSPARYVPQG